MSNGGCHASRSIPIGDLAISRCCKKTTPRNKPPAVAASTKGCPMSDIGHEPVRGMVSDEGGQFLPIGCGADGTKMQHPAPLL